jgi:molybdenum cofactor guanylyltransferase
MTEIACVILAGGLARRMGGGDKPLKLVGGRTILARVIDRVRPSLAALVLNANGDPARFAETGLEVVADAIPDHPGPLAGILAGMRWAAARGHRQLVSVPADAPFLPRDLVTRLAETNAPLACAASGGWTHPVVGLWDTALANDLEAAVRAGERKIDRWTGRHGCVAVEWPATPFDPFHNANTPEDLVDAEAILARHPEA